MTKHVFRTALGPIPLWGDLAGFSPDRPLLLVIRGAFADADQFEGLRPLLPHVDVAFTHLPGIHTPYLQESSIPAFASAFDETIAEAFTGRAVNVLAASMAGQVAMSLKTPVRAIVGLDTPLSMDGLWPMRDILRAKMREGPQMADWIWNLFGVDETRMEARDHRHLLDTLQPWTRMLVGSVPLMPERAVPEMPSLVSSADLELYRRHPRVSLKTVRNTGHNIPRHGQRAIFDSLLEAMPPPAAT